MSAVLRTRMPNCHVEGRVNKVDNLESERFESAGAQASSCQTSCRAGEYLLNH